MISVEWMAGIVDGEGCIGIYPRGGAREEYYLQLRVTNTEIELVKPFEKAFGGSLRVVKEGRYNLNGLDYYVWTVSHKKAASALATLLPLLRSSRKQKAAALGVKFQRQKNLVRPWAKGHMERQREFYLRSKEINKRGRA